MDQKKFLDLIKRDGLLGVLIALLVYFGTALQHNQTQLSKELLNIKIKLVQIENKMVDEDRVTKLIDKAIKDHEEKHIYQYHNGNNSNY